MPLNVQSLIDAWYGQVFLSEDDVRSIERICRKGEISKKIFVCYEDDFSNIDGADFLPKEYAERLVFVALKAYKQSKNFKFLNAALKIADGTLSAPVYMAGRDVWTELDNVLGSAILNERA